VGQCSEDTADFIFETLNGNDPNRVPELVGIHRFFDTVTGTHFWTASLDENNFIIAEIPTYTHEFQNFAAYDGPMDGLLPVWRLFDETTGEHWFTTSDSERDGLLDNVDSDWEFERAAFYVYPQAQDDTIPAFGFLNTENGVPFFTASQAESDYVLDNLPIFTFQGEVFHVMPVSALGN
jgi:hypothetical protein